MNTLSLGRRTLHVGRSVSSRGWITSTPLPPLKDILVSAWFRLNANNGCSSNLWLWRGYNCVMNSLPILLVLVHDQTLGEAITASAKTFDVHWSLDFPRDESRDGAA